MAILILLTIGVIIMDIHSNSAIDEETNNELKIIR